MEESPRVSDGGAADKERVMRLLEREAASAKQREMMKMLESLVQQTNELEQAKIVLEEARLEAQTRTQQQWSVKDLMFGGVDEEINGLCARLRASAQAEERSRKAADEHTAALSAVSMEAKQVKAWLCDAWDELVVAHAERDQLRGLLQGAEAELWSATERIDALTADWKDAVVEWHAREKALLARARGAEEEAAAAWAESAVEIDAARRALANGRERRDRHMF
ncbi:WEB family protein At3g02930, chloroplastic-like [Miscanthus floridulus]|uniref:WEB family protein At3g02930, chloroplastic-like n=1 Tax=Miscanthus floridulus TaxID=154761 RepID=UPI003459D86C